MWMHLRNRRKNAKAGKAWRSFSLKGLSGASVEVVRKDLKKHPLTRIPRLWIDRGMLDLP
jgi:hypothetical protein